eukprot:GCRY01003760.1.p1 GENE.GCRY01003760.1~~GCRY01003760.1.p1  ORF type:complete len:511 (-),score=86.69 GCRY01003760.1:69-1601(-)
MGISGSKNKKKKNFQDGKDIGPSAPAPIPVIRTYGAHKVYDEEGFKQLNQYQILKSLGKGTYGKVKLCKNVSNNQLYALKVFNKLLFMKGSMLVGNGSNKLEQIHHEVAIMKCLEHPNIVKLHEVIESEKKVYLVMEYVEGGPLLPTSECCDPFSEEDSRHFFRDIVEGLEYLHEHHVIHRDIKPENLLVAKDGTVKISDFGVSQFFEDGDDSTTSCLGSPAFHSPELCEGGLFHCRGSDVWALGVTLFIMSFGKMPFVGENVLQLYDSIIMDHPNWPLAPTVTPALQDLLTKLLEKDPNRRITLREIRTHPWVTCNGLQPMRPPPQHQEDILGLLSTSCSSVASSLNSVESFSASISRSQTELNLESDAISCHAVAGADGSAFSTPYDYSPYSYDAEDYYYAENGAEEYVYDDSDYYEATETESACDSLTPEEHPHHSSLPLFSAPTAVLFPSHSLPSVQSPCVCGSDVPGADSDPVRLERLARVDMCLGSLGAKADPPAGGDALPLCS